MPTLHVTNGDCAAGTLRTFLTDRVLVTHDVLHDGPAPLVDGTEWHAVRARFLTDEFSADYARTLESLAAFDRAVTTSDPSTEVVLWFEHDLFDQLLLIQTLAVIGAAGTDRNVSLICIGAFPGIDRFIGLGQLTAEQLASLYPSRARVTPEQYSLAAEAWRAFRLEDPRELLGLMNRLRTQPTSPLPFLADAIQRLFEEYPSTTNGLSRTETALLGALRDGPVEAGALFYASQTGEPRPFLGDLGCFDILRAMATARVPFVTITGDASSADLRGHLVDATDAGRSVLNGHLDAVAQNGIDLWRGGVHLQGANRSPWRWDPEHQTLVS